MSPIQIDQLRPYRSFTLVSIQSGHSFEQATRATLEALVASLELRDTVEIVTHEAWVAGDRAAFLHYRVRRVPSWVVGNVDVVDVANQLITVVARQRRLAIYCSEDWAKKTILSMMQSQSELPEIKPIEPWRLEEAIIRDHEQKTLWLSGIHRRTAVKADNKVLSGIDLRYALDPLDDQSFSFTAARAVALFGDVKESVGVAPQKSAVWMGVANSWKHHRDTARALLDLVHAAEHSDQVLIPVLAQAAADNVSLADLGEPFDVGFVPSEYMQFDLDDGLRELAEQLYRLDTAVRVERSALILSVAATGDPEVKLEYALELDLAKSRAVRWAVEPLGEVPDGFSKTDELIQETLQHRPTWLKVWFDSGFVLADRSLFRQQHRDLPFKEWHWASFVDFDVTKEKPDLLTAENIGHGDSLFCWVATRTALPWGGNLGWLASNDGSMEIADFIHVDPQGRTLTLVHVKGANSASDGRKVSVSSYEVVVGQAVKNIRHVDHELLAGGFMQSLDRRLQAAVWSDGEFLGKDGRLPMKRAIEDLGANFRRRVVILQPHVRRSALQAARDSNSARDKLAASQLDALLLSARGACQGVGAEFLVIGEDT